MPKNNKLTKYEHSRRIKEVAKLLCLGQGRSDIYEHANKQGWDKSERQLDNYIQDATALLKERLLGEIDEEKAKAIDRAIMIFQQSIKAGERKIALAANEQIAKLHGLYIERREVTGADGEALKIVVEYGSDSP